MTLWKPCWHSRLGEPPPWRAGSEYNWLWPTLCNVCQLLTLTIAACSIQPPFWWIVRAATPESPTGQYRNIYVQQSWANTGINSRLISLFCGIWVMLRCNKSAHLYISRQTSGIQSLTHDPDQAPDQATPAWCYKAILSVTNSSSHLIGSTSD